MIVAEIRVARHIEERGPGVLFGGGSERLVANGSQAEEFVFPPAQGMIVGESPAVNWKKYRLRGGGGDQLLDAPVRTGRTRAGVRKIRF
jgi:hypothetical protein